MPALTSGMRNHASSKATSLLSSVPTLRSSARESPGSTLPSGRDANCKSGVFESKLFRLLKRLPLAHRRALIARSLSQNQRKALERWMLARRSKLIARKHLRDLRSAKRAPDSPSAKRLKRTSYEEWAGLEAFEKHVFQHVGIHPRSGFENLSSKSRRTSCHPKSSTGVAGIITHRPRGGRVYYRASIGCGPFRLFSKTAHCLPSALQRLKALSEVQEKFEVTAGWKRGSAGCADAAMSFRRAFLQEPVDPAAAHTSPKGVVLGFCFTIHAKFWIGKVLYSPRFACTAAGVASGIDAWEKLQEARNSVYHGPTNRFKSLARHHSTKELEAAWLRIRDAYLEMWEQAGRARSTSAQRLDEMRRKCRQKSGASLPVL